VRHPASTAAEVVRGQPPRRPRKHRLAACLAVAVLTSPFAAFAREPAESEDSTSSASALVERGIALRRAGDDLGALELFQQAEQLEPGSTRVKVHLAANYQALGQWEQADKYLTQALQDPNDPYVLRHQATLASAREAVDRHIGLLQLSGSPAGTEVRLNGRPIGTLPLARTVRVAAGIYTLEAHLTGYYPVTRSVALGGGALVRESLELTPLAGATRPAAAGRDTPRAASSQATWLPWVLGGLALGAGAATVGAWAIREQHASRWNDDEQCLGPTRTREQLCGNEIRDGERAQNVMWIAGSATAAFATATVVTLWFQSDSREAPLEALGCGLGIGQLRCAGRF